MDSPLIPFFSVNSTTGQIQQWNKVMIQATGFQPTDVQGKSVDSLLSLDKAACCKSSTSTGSLVIETLLEQPKVEATPKGKTGNDVHLILSAHQSSTHNSTCKTTSKTILVLCQDVTLLQQVTAQRNEATQLAESERSLTEWLSHEIRNPLSVVMEAAQTLEAAAQDAPMNAMPSDLHHSVFGGSYLQLIRHSITYVVDILTNMLDLNQLAEGKMTLRPETCRVCDDILLPTKYMMTGMKRQVPVEISGPNVELHVDKLRLKQVFCNLISNANKYTSEGVIRIQVHEPSNNDGRLTITISDSGVGISPAHYPHLFSRFEKLGSSINGAGIGLCLCKNLLTAMGGDICLNKEYHSGIVGFPGAQFVVQIPCTTVPAPPAFDALSAALMATAAATTKPTKKKCVTQATTTMRPKIPPNTHLRGNFRILIVDDELIGQKLLVRRFQRIFPSATIDTSPSGERAVEMATSTKTQQPYDLITMDHYMAVHEMTGSETIRALRTQGVNALIVGISGNAMRQEHLAAGADEFFQKPLPATNIVVEQLWGKIPPPAGWKVLLVDDTEVNLHLLERKLQAVAVPHASASEPRWDIVQCTVGARAKVLMEENRYDMVVMDQTLENPSSCESLTGTELGKLGRKTQNKDVIFVLNSGSPVGNGELPSCFDLSWSKPLPSVEELRNDLYRQLLVCPKAATGPVKQ
eukprot:Sro678_g185910.2  (693) ;mRNA; r:17516-19594